MSTRRDHDDDPQGGVVVEEKTTSRLQRPRLYRVLLHNDDYTPMEFVVRLLQVVFRRSESDATRIMLQVHNEGVGVAGVYTYEVAETKVARVHQQASHHEVPLMASMEPEDPDDGEDSDA